MSITKDQEIIQLGLDKMHLENQIQFLTNKYSIAESALKNIALDSTVSRRHIERIAKESLKSLSKMTFELGLSKAPKSKS